MPYVGSADTDTHFEDRAHQSNRAMVMRLPHRAGLYFGPVASLATSSSVQLVLRPDQIGSRPRMMEVNIF